MSRRTRGLGSSCPAGCVLPPRGTGPGGSVAVATTITTREPRVSATHAVHVTALPGRSAPGSSAAPAASGNLACRTEPDCWHLRQRGHSGSMPTPRRGAEMRPAARSLHAVKDRKGQATRAVWRRPAVQVRDSDVSSHGGDPHVRGRSIRVALRGLRQAAFGAASPGTAQVGVRGVPEQALPTPIQRDPAGAEPLLDATAEDGSEAGGSRRRSRSPLPAGLPAWPVGVKTRRPV